MGRLRSFIGSASYRALPERIGTSIARRQDEAEIPIAWIQLAIVALFALVYGLAPKAFSPRAHFEPVPWVLGAYAAVTALRLALAYRRRLGRALLALFVVLDMALLMVLIWSFHLQYMQPPAFYLKVPTLFSAFIFIALRTLRFEAGFVVLAGLVAALGWAALVAFAVISQPDQVVMHDFVAYVTSNRILIGAEVEKILAILTVTAVLAVAITRARGVLVRSVADGIAARDLSRFFAPEVAARIRRAQAPLAAGEGETRDAAILYVDVRGFTALGAALPPAALLRLLAEYQARMVPAIQRQGGSIDKFLGDGIMATFGAVAPSPAYAAEALQAVDGLLAEAARWNAERQAAGAAAIAVNCAVAAGRVVFGAVGDATRLEYTVIGDTVNLAAKLEKHNKPEGTAALATLAAYEAALAQGYHPRRPRDDRRACRVTGLAEPVDLVALA